MKIIQILTWRDELLAVGDDGNVYRVVPRWDSHEAPALVLWLQAAPAVNG